MCLSCCVSNTTQTLFIAQLFIPLFILLCSAKQKHNRYFSPVRWRVKPWRGIQSRQQRKTEMIEGILQDSSTWTLFSDNCGSKRIMHSHFWMQYWSNKAVLSMNDAAVILSYILAGKNTKLWFVLWNTANSDTPLSNSHSRFHFFFPAATQPSF